MSGLALWKMTLLSIATKENQMIKPEDLVLGRKIWKEIKRGMPHTMDAFLSMSDAGMEGMLDNWNISNYRYIPKMFDTKQ